MDIIRKAISMPLLCRQDQVVNTHSTCSMMNTRAFHQKSTETKPKSFVQFRIKVREKRPTSADQPTCVCIEKEKYYKQLRVPGGVNHVYWR